MSSFPNKQERELRAGLRGKKTINRFWTGGMCCILLLNVLASCGNVPNREAELDKPAVEYELSDHDPAKFKEQREQTEQFITRNLYGPYGVRTNFRDSGQSDTVATGHEVLSESAGLLMRYYVLTNQQDAFQAEWELTKRVFELPSGFSYRYSPKFDKKYAINAAVDDLRVIRALHEAGNHFHRQEYIELADIYGKRFFKFNVKGGKLYDFYDETYRITNDFVTLCYIDLPTLKQLPVSAKQKSTLIGNMQKILQNGYLSDAFPFYETRFQYDTETYRSEEIRTIESLLTILTLSEAGLERPESIAYLKEQVKNGTLYGQYDRNGTPLNDVQSTAIYAIAAMIGSEVKDTELYEDSIKQMEKFRIMDENSPLDGGFGDPVTQTAFSFDNLMALLAYAY